MPSVVVDIGNSRMKWGLVNNGHITTHCVLDHDDTSAWNHAVERWKNASNPWLIASVVPNLSFRFQQCLQSHGIDSVNLTNEVFLRSVSDTFCTRVYEPNAIGIDRLLSSYAAFRKVETGGSVVAINVGTAMTVDFIDSSGNHEGGAILPGPRLMAKSLHGFTAKLPLTEVFRKKPSFHVGRNTMQAIQLGIATATLHTADQLILDWNLNFSKPSIFITGGDLNCFENFAFTADVGKVTMSPLLTLEGLLMASQYLK